MATTELKRDEEWVAQTLAALRLLERGVERTNVAECRCFPWQSVHSLLGMLTRRAGLDGNLIADRAAQILKDRTTGEDVSDGT